MAQSARQMRTDAIVRDLKHALMDAPTNDPSAAELIHALTEAHTALGSYLSAIKQIVESDPALSQARLCEAIDASIGQSERADDALRQLRSLLLGRRRDDRDTGGSR